MVSPWLVALWFLGPTAHFSRLYQIPFCMVQIESSLYYRGEELSKFTKLPITCQSSSVHQDIKLFEIVEAFTEFQCIARCNEFTWAECNASELKDDNQCHMYSLNTNQFQDLRGSLDMYFRDIPGILTAFTYEHDQQQHCLPLSFFL